LGQKGGNSTFFASLRAFRCFSADAFWILCRSRTGWRFDFGSEFSLAAALMANFGVLTSYFHLDQIL
jgi:hypothetical protein